MYPNSFGLLLGAAPWALALAQTLGDHHIGRFEDDDREEDEGRDDDANEQHRQRHVHTLRARKRGMREERRTF